MEIELTRDIYDELEAQVVDRRLSVAALIEAIIMDYLHPEINPNT